VDVRRFHRWLWALLAAGLLLRLALIVLSPGVAPDIASLALVAEMFRADPLAVYDINVATATQTAANRWPYPPVVLPVVGLVDVAADLSRLSFQRLVRVVFVLADLAIAVVVGRALAARGAPARVQLGGVGLVALGPCFFFISAVHGQMDAVAWLPALVAVVLWDARRERPRALAAGLALGLAVAVKTTPLVLLLALLASARSRREALTLVGATVAVPALALLPFALTAPEGLSALAGYRGIGGRGGLTLLVQPELALLQLSGVIPELTPLTTFLLDNTALVLAPPLLVVAALLRRRRTPAPQAAVTVVLTLYVFSAVLLPQYFLWVIPLLVVAGFLRTAALLQLALTPVLVAVYLNLLDPGRAEPILLGRALVLYGYVPLVAAITVGFAVGVVLLLRRPTPPSGLSTDRPPAPTNRWPPRPGRRAAVPR